MWNLNFQPPTIVEASIWSSIPEEFRVPKENEWASVNKPGQLIDSFLEGPVFDAHGNLYVTDIPYGRIFKISPTKSWELVIQYDGMPNGLAIDQLGMIWISDYKQGLLKLDPSAKNLEVILSGPENNEDKFLGLNDLVFDKKGIYFLPIKGKQGFMIPPERCIALSLAVSYIKY